MKKRGQYLNFRRHSWEEPHINQIKCQRNTSVFLEAVPQRFLVKADHLNYERPPS